jgi:hypothetical protein
MIAIRLVALRAILITNYIGFRTGMMLPEVGREVTLWDVWILNAWLVMTGGIEFALLGLLLRFVIRRFSNQPNVPSFPSKGLN